MTIQRYNQGFGGFGPLEKCDDGKLVKYADLEVELSRCEVEFDYFLNEIKECDDSILYKNHEISELKRKIKGLKSDFFLITIIAALAIIFYFMP